MNFTKDSLSPSSKKIDELQSLPKRHYKNVKTNVTLNKLAQNEDLLGAIGRLAILFLSNSLYLPF